MGQSSGATPPRLASQPLALRQKNGFRGVSQLNKTLGQRFVTLQAGSGARSLSSARSLSAGHSFWSTRLPGAARFRWRGPS